MQRNELLDLLVETDHVAQLNRVLAGFKRRRKSTLGTVETIELANQTACADYRRPNPEPALQVAVKMELLRRSGHMLTLTKIGGAFLQARRIETFDVSLRQATLLLGLFLDDRGMTANVESVIRQFGKGSTDELEAKTSPATWDLATQDTAKVLQQLGVIIDRDGQLFLSQRFEAVIPKSILKQALLSEEALWAKLEAQRLRGRAAEKFVVREERKRLVRIGRRDLSELVFRVSDEDPTAGYDIKSFERDESDRHIEVKSSTGKAIRFEWSVGERNFAKDNRDSYWIYFVPLAEDLENRTLPIQMIRDPIAKIRSKMLRETPSSYAVTEVMPTSYTSRPVSAKPPMLEWRP